MTSSWRLDETSCGYLCCQHPSCWASQRRQEKGIPNVLPPIQRDSDSSDEEIDLPTQSICNLLGDYGDSTIDRYPLSAGGRPSYQWDTSSMPKDSPGTDDSFVSRLNLTAPHNTKASLQSKRTQQSLRKPKLKLVEMQEVFDRDDLNSQWDETFMTKQYYVWMPNPNRKRKGERHLEKKTPNPVLMKDHTECMVPSEIEHKREETVLFDEFPVLKKRQPRTKSPQRSFMHGPAVAPYSGDIDRDGINEILSLPKETLMKVLEYTKKSDFTSKGKLHSIVQSCVNEDEQVQMALSARELFTHKPMEILDGDHAKKTPHRALPTQPVFQLDDDGVIDRLSYVNTPVKEKDLCSEADSVDTFPRYRRPLPNILGKRRVDKTNKLSQSAQLHRPKVASISLGLPELPSGIKTTKPFTYRKQDIDFSLGPVITPPSSYRSSLSGAYSDHGTTVKVNASSTMIGLLDGYGQESKELGFHSVSPAFSTNVPVPPAGTPATFQSPTKSAPNMREITRDATQMTVNWSLHAQPPSREVVKDEILIPSPGLMDGQVSPNTTFAAGLETGDEQGLDTINETARENQDGSVASPHVAGIDRSSNSEANVPHKMHLETSALSNIHTAVTPLPKSARSVESCPSPEQWPLVSESSFEQMNRISISEPALSARSDRRRAISRGKDDQGKGVNKDYARKVLNEKIDAESPAPPPPSPEPKEPGEYRSRKDIKSRESLSMAPLFEVTETEEGSPAPQADTRDVQERQGKTRHIEVTVPMGKEQIKDKKKEQEEEVEMVSQITVTHIPPKGRDPNVKTGEKVQETFLNVDIPAEDISSVKAENGSSHHEDISSSDTVVQSHNAMTASESSPTPRDDLDVKMGDVTPEAEDTTLMLDGMDELTVQEDELNTGKQDGDSQKDGSNLSTESPELQCDSARFFGHELVSPAKESDILNSTIQENAEMLSARNGENTDETEMKGEFRLNIGENEVDSTQNQDQDLNEPCSEIARADSPEGEQTMINFQQSQLVVHEDETSFNGEIPGSFFFTQSSPDEVEEPSDEVEQEPKRREESTEEQVQEMEKKDDVVENRGWMERAVASVEFDKEDQQMEATKTEDLSENEDSTDKGEAVSEGLVENDEQSMEVVEKGDLNRTQSVVEENEDAPKECDNGEKTEEAGKKEDLNSIERQGERNDTQHVENENTDIESGIPQENTEPTSSPTKVIDNAEADVTVEEERC